MALRNQPYLPLYVQDFLTDEKLLLCSPAATGVYIRLMCILHKSEEYGTILLGQNFQQKPSTIENFAALLSRFMPYSVDEISSGLLELVSNSVITITSDKLSQKRMVKDNAISEARSAAGSAGGFATAKRTANRPAKVSANTEYENENNDNKEEVVLEEEKPKEEKKKKEPDALFELFWDQYHLMTQKPKEDREAAMKYWVKMTKDEKKLAISSIEAYSRTNEPRYLKKARTYLSDKSFNNEFAPVIQTPKMVY